MKYPQKPQNSSMKWAKSCKPYDWNNGEKSVTRRNKAAPIMRGGGLNIINSSFYIFLPNMRIFERNENAGPDNPKNHGRENGCPAVGHAVEKDLINYKCTQFSHSYSLCPSEQTFQEKFHAKFHIIYQFSLFFQYI